MADGINPQEVSEAPRESQEVSAAARQIEQITYSPEENLEGREVQQAESLQSEFETLVLSGDAAPETPIPAGKDAAELSIKDTIAADDSGLRDTPAEDSSTSSNSAEELASPREDDPTGKQAFSSPASDPGDHYTAVELTPGEVVQDSDWNEPPDQAVEESEPAGIQFTPSGEDGSVRGNADAALDSSDGSAEMESVPTQETAMDQVSQVDSFTWKQGVAKDEVGDFRVPGLHGEPPEIPQSEIPDQSGPERPAWGAGPAPPGIFARAEDPPAYDPDARPEKASSDGQAEPPQETAEGEVDPRLPLDFTTSPAGLRKYAKNSTFILSDQLEGELEQPGKLTLEDLVLSVLPWPFHKDLPGQPLPAPENTEGMLASLSVPIVTSATIETLIDILEDVQAAGEDDPALKDLISTLEDLIGECKAASAGDPGDDRQESRDEELAGEILRLAVDLKGRADQQAGGTNDAIKKLPLGDLVLSVLPWPFHKDLSDIGSDPGAKAPPPEDLPIGDLLAEVARWYPTLVTAFPLPGLKEKDADDDD